VIKEPQVRRYTTFWRISVRKIWNRCCD